MLRFRKVGAACLTACLFLGACEDPEQKARYVKAPLESSDLEDRTSLNQAIDEARTRLASVRDARLRADLAADIDRTNEHALAGIRAREEAARQTLEAERRHEAERERAVAAAIQAERKNAADRLRAAEKRDYEEPPEADQDERRRAAVAAQFARTKEAVTDLEIAMRSSALNDATRVLVLRNGKPYPTNFDLQCFTPDGVTSKTFAVTIPAGGERHIGFLQGWRGNFKGRERCEAYVAGELMWEYTVPD